MIEVCKKAATHLKPAVASRLQFCVHEFFHKQPVKGASMRLIRAVMHNWPDKDAVKILGNTVTAMKPSTSILMIRHSSPSSWRHTGQH